MYVLTCNYAILKYDLGGGMRALQRTFDFHSISFKNLMTYKKKKLGTSLKRMNNLLLVNIQAIEEGIINLSI